MSTFPPSVVSFLYACPRNPRKAAVAIAGGARYRAVISDDMMRGLDTYVPNPDGQVLLVCAKPVELAHAIHHPQFDEWVRLVTSGHGVRVARTSKAMLGHALDVYPISPWAAQPATDSVTRAYDEACPTPTNRPASAT